MNFRRWLGFGLALALTGCSQRAEPPPSRAPAQPPRAPATAKLPLDPVRVEAAEASRKALSVMAQSIACPQRPPSAFAKFCAVADAFEHGTAAEVPAGAALLLPGVVASIEPGPPGIATLGTPVPVVLVLRRDGTRVVAKMAVLRDPGEPDAIETALGRIGGALDGKWDHVDLPASFAPQIAALADAAGDPLEASGGSYWPVGRDGFELRRAGGHWMGMSSPAGPEGRHFVSVYADHLRVLAPKEKSPQTVHVLHL